MLLPLLLPPVKTLLLSPPFPPRGRRPLRPLLLFPLLLLLLLLALLGRCCAGAGVFFATALASLAGSLAGGFSFFLGLSSSLDELLPSANVVSRATNMWLSSSVTQIACLSILA